MKNRIIAFASILVATAFLFSCSSDDDNANETNLVTTSAKYKDVRSANREINAAVQGTMNDPSNASRSLKNSSNDCVTLTSELTETGGTATITFGENCTSPDGKAISGTILLSYKMKEASGELAFDITYTLENFSFNGITVSGSSIATYNILDKKFVTDSDYKFIWDDGLSVVSKNTTSVEIVINEESAESYTLINMDTKAEFSSGELYTSKTTTPMRVENDCKYVVSGILVTSENASTITLNYGDGTCDNVATQTDSEGNVTTIDLDVEENFTL
ncbi:hypothetical protein IWQ47_002353 [Aquimarina sp. EL_43]|uniref:hypothetical protein n=1 Tax=unclassified Aquimarina TaxID=2627091 RepID=UPI0018C99C42|nr:MULTISPECIES: hypothetical protein [unclassified Aquimarina]MBG6130883.1 hypothetical protein [Aquimarina sp. EL_35]MBG6151342.1 hypothetical protein [Aquimarina sp. EL_32]MBG6169273.1 hypothetical protein [Aquimarina sp. EL_43]